MQAGASIYRMLAATLGPIQLNFFLTVGLAASFHLDSGKLCSLNVASAERGDNDYTYPLPSK